MNIRGLQKTTLLDYPEHVAATIFIGGCNFRCPFCHNKDLVIPGNEPDEYSTEQVLSFLDKRKNILDGVCITGGEPTLQPGLIDFIRQIRALGYHIKLDTNGYCPDVLSQLLQDHLIDYCAMDIKGSPDRYAEICGKPDLDLSLIYESISLLLSSNIDYEFRTTIMKEFHSAADFKAIAPMLKGTRHYFLQSYKDSENIISGGFHAYTAEELEAFRQVLLPHIPHVALRGEL